MVNYLLKNSSQPEKEKAEQFYQQKQKLEAESSPAVLAMSDSIIRKHTTGKYASAVDLVYFNEADIVSVKKFMLSKELNLVQDQMNLLRQLRSSSNSALDQQRISDEIEQLEYLETDLLDQVDLLDEQENKYRLQGYNLVYNSSSMQSQDVAERLQIQSGELLVSADSLEQLASLKKRKERKAMELQAKVLKMKAQEMTTSSAEIVALENRAAYRENLIAIQKATPKEFTTARNNQALQTLEMSKTNYEIAIENRVAANNKDLSGEERESLLTEAANLEILALNQQKQALDIFIESQDSLTQAQLLADRGAGEEIPTDSPDQLAQNQINQTEADTSDSQSQEIAQNQNEIIPETDVNQTDLPNNQEVIANQNTETENQIQTENFNLTVADVQQMNETQILAIKNRNLLQPEIQRALNLKQANVIGIFAEANSNENYYSNEKPIEIQSSMPKGLIFKVQIAAFRNIVEPEYFKGLKPISIEQRPNSNWYRYLAGLFTEYDEALSARGDIRGMGYSDAFIVAYFNGQRITIAQARAMIESGVAYTDESIASAAQATGQEVYTSTVAAQQVAGAESTVLPQNPQQISEGDFSSPQLFYAVQVGVYGSPRTRDRLYNLDELYYGRMTNGYYRYFNGKYTEFSAAQNAQAQIRSLGIRDAFVVAFYNGEKISVRQARNIAPTLNPEPQQEPEAAEVNPQETQNIQPEQTENPVVEQNLQETQAETETETENVVYEVTYKVQLGAFRNNIPVEIVNSMLQIALPIDKETRADGITVYTTGNFSNFAEASAMRSRVVQNGIIDAFVVAFVNGERSNIERARELENR